VGQWARLQVENGRRDVNFGFADHDHPSAATAPWDQPDECFAPLHAYPQY